jgi:hypothetical protein
MFIEHPMHVRTTDGQKVGNRGPLKKSIKVGRYRPEKIKDS